MLTYLTFSQLIYLCVACGAASLIGLVGTVTSVVLLASSWRTIGAVGGTAVAVLGLAWTILFC